MQPDIEEPDFPEYLTTNEAAQRAGVHPSKVRRLARLGRIKAGKLPGTKAGYRFLESDIDAIRRESEEVSQ